MAESLKLVLVGDGTVGKTCVLCVYTSGKFPQDYVPTIVDSSFHDASVDNHSVCLRLYDTAGQEEYDRLRPLSYPGTGVFLLCFSVDSRNSYNNVHEKWQPELNHHCPGVPIVLVATKADLRTDEMHIQDFKRRGETMVSSEEGRALARRIDACKYLECSAKFSQGVDTVFQEAARVCFVAKDPGKKKPKKGKGCGLL